MTKAIVVEYVAFKEGVEITAGSTTIFGSKTYNKLMIQALNGLRYRYDGCTVYANKVNILL